MMAARAFLSAGAGAREAYLRSNVRRKHRRYYLIVATYVRSRAQVRDISTKKFWYEEMDERERWSVDYKSLRQATKASNQITR